MAGRLAIRGLQRAIEAELAHHFLFKTCWNDLAPIGDGLFSLFANLRAV